MTTTPATARAGDRALVGTVGITVDLGLGSLPAAVLERQCPTVGGFGTSVDFSVHGHSTVAMEKGAFLLEVLGMTGRGRRWVPAAGTRSEGVNHPASEACLVLRDFLAHAVVTSRI